MEGIKAPRVVRNCPASWARMHGDAQVRFCTHCDQKVYNLSEMTKEEASAFMREQTGHVCVRYFQREDGTLLTSDCGRVERTRIRVKAATVTAITLLGLAAKFGTPASSPGMEEPVTGKIATPRPMMGDIAAPVSMGAMPAPKSGQKS